MNNGWSQTHPMSSKGRVVTSKKKTLLHKAVSSTGSFKNPCFMICWIQNHVLKECHIVRSHLKLRVKGTSRRWKQSGITCCVFGSGLKLRVKQTSHHQKQSEITCCETKEHHVVGSGLKSRVVFQSNLKSRLAQRIAHSEDPEAVWNHVSLHIWKIREQSEITCCLSKQSEITS